MGYTTTFEGAFTVTPPLNEHEIAYLKVFAETRRMDREEGPLYAENDGNFGQTGTPGIRDYNRPPAGQPGLWCQWVPTDDGTEIEWDGGEKFYNAGEWLRYYIDRLLGPEAKDFVAAHVNENEHLQYFTCDHILNGEVMAQGEDPDDRWVLIAQNNEVMVDGITSQRAGKPVPIII